jgi:serine-type D-Ala-D-Ala carboxypeptidase (penicillin-binding protein 5/6)
MLDRIRPRAVLIGALLVVVAVLVAAPASAAGPGGPPSAVSASPSSSASPSPSSASASVIAPIIGGLQLASRGVVVSYPSRSVPRLPGIQASAFVIADAGTGQVLAARDPHGWYRPASTLKVLTAVSLIPVLNPDGTVVASRQATTTVPNVVGLVAGRAYEISDLFTALLTISANDAAIALTQATGSFSQGMALINAEARHLQADDTVAVDPNGLDAPGQHTSAYDLALIARQALKMPAFLKYDQTMSARFVVARRKAVGLYNQNALLTTYPGAVGGKIGWTSAAGATYVGMATRHGVTLIVTLLHCPALTEISSAKKLLDWGFAADGKVTPVGTLAGSRQPISASPSPAAAAPSVRAAIGSDSDRDHAASPSVLAAAGFSCAAVLAVVLGFTYSRRQRLRAARSADADRTGDRVKPT